MCVAFFSLAGGHWLVLQTVAWAQMLRDYSKSAPIAEAIERTFSGDYPCPMCIKITREQQEEEKAPATVKLEGGTLPPACARLAQKTRNQGFFLFALGRNCRR
jgi:hypothetical protein